MLRLIALAILCCCGWAATARGQVDPDLDETGPTAAEVAPEAGLELPGEIGAPAEVKKPSIPTDPLGLFRAGGFMMYPLLIASVLMVWCTLERLVILRRQRVIPRAFVARFLQHLEQGKLDADAALQLCEENASPVAMVFAHGLRKWGKPSVEVEQAIIDGGERQVAQLRKNLRMLNGVSNVSPLLGLLGTVVGMILSFNNLAQSEAGAKTAQLAAGIGIALITTAGGLFVAIPALILYMYFVGRVDSLVMEMDDLSQRVVNLISAEALGGRSRPTPKPAPAAAPPSATLTPRPKPAVTTKS